MRVKELHHTINMYLNGDLSANEVDKLWAELLGNPEYLQWFEIEVTARKYFSENPDEGGYSKINEGGQSDPAGEKPGWFQTDLKPPQ